MNVFISWSGQTSRAVAEVLHHWLPKVIQAVDPWMSAKDIQAGARWGPEIAKKLENARYAIICLTADNAEAPWLNFETGALAKVVEHRVAPYLFGITPANIPSNHPLTLFQAVRADKAETRKLLTSLNESLDPSRQLASSAIDEGFDVWWPKLEKALQAIPPPTHTKPKSRSLEDIATETLQLVRRISNTLVLQSESEPEPPQIAPVVDLMAALKQSLAQIKEERKHEANKSPAALNTLPPGFKLPGRRRLRPLGRRDG